MKKVWLLLIVLIVSFLGCNKMGSSNGLNLFPEQKDGKVIASFDGIKITDEYVKSYLDQLNPYLRSRYSDDEKKKELITRIVEGELLAHYALREGAATDAVLLTKIKSNIARFYMGSVLKNKIEEGIKVTPAEIKKYYEENKEKYTQPAKVKASHILVKITDKRDEAAAKALAQKVEKELLTTKNRAQSFVKLVQQYSDDAGSKRRGGDVGYFATVKNGGRMVKEFTTAAFALKNIGDVSPLIKTEFGFHIIKLTGKKDASEKNIADVSKRIESALKADKRKAAYEKALDDIKAKTNFVFDDVAVAAIKIEVPEDAKKAPGMGKGKQGQGPGKGRGMGMGQGGKKPPVQLNKQQLNMLRNRMKKQAPAPQAQEK